MNFQRAAKNSRRCTFPGCIGRDELHKISRHDRYNVMKRWKLYIPDGAKACNRHKFSNGWANVQNTGRQWFSKNHIEDLIHMLCDTSRINISDTPGNYDLKKLIHN